MANKSMKLCSFPGCKNLVPYGTRFCPYHEQNKSYHICNMEGCSNLTKERYCEECLKKIQKKDNEERADRRDKYSRNWRQLSIHIRNKEPFCRECLKMGKYTPSECVDHIDNDPSNNNENNLQALCWSCHSRKTAREKGGWKRRETAQEGEGV